MKWIGIVIKKDGTPGPGILTRVLNLAINMKRDLLNTFRGIKDGTLITTGWKHRHKWQTMAQNRYGHCTYRVCLECRQAEKWEGSINGHYGPSIRMPEFDEQFDENDEFIKH
jgi:hypothetical protein